MIMIWAVSALTFMLVVCVVILGKRRRAQRRRLIEVDPVTGKISIIPGAEFEHSPGTKNSRTGVGLQGNLAQTPLHDLLQYLSLGTKSGILELTCGRRTGRMVFKDGKVSKSSYRDKEGFDAIFMMMDLAEGDFEFYQQELKEDSPQADLEVVDILMLWMDGKPKQESASN